MSHLPDATEYLNLIQPFLNGRLEPDVFIEEYSRLWRRDRDRMVAIRTCWPERYDVQLLEARERGELSSNEFHYQWVRLFGYAGYEDLLDMMGDIFSERDFYEPDPAKIRDPQWQRTEDEFRAYIAKSLGRYEAKEAAKRTGDENSA